MGGAGLLGLPDLSAPSLAPDFRNTLTVNTFHAPDDIGLVLRAADTPLPVLGVSQERASVK